jgi:hypothetical protein
MKLEQIMENLAKPIPENKLKIKTLKGNSIPFVPWYNLVDLLNERCGVSGWEWTIKTLYQINSEKATTQEDGTIKLVPNNFIAIVGSLTIHGEDGSITREATGQEPVNVTGYGDSTSNAEAMAIRRCCAKFGLGIDLWRKLTGTGGTGGGTTKAPTLLPTTKGELTRDQWLARQRGN